MNYAYQELNRLCCYTTSWSSKASKKITQDGVA